MKLARSLVACLSLSLVACDKKKSEPAPKPTPTAPAPGSAATPPPAAGTAAPAPGSAATPPPADPGAAAAAGDGIKLPHTPRQVGDKVTETEEQIMVAKATVSPTQIIDLNSTERKVEVKEAVAVDGDAITKLKISYPTFTIDETVGGKPRAKPTPTVGKTYLVWREGDELKVSYEDGSAPSPEEIKVVKKGNRSVGRPDPLDKFLADHVWKIGEKVDLTAEQLAAINQNMGGEGEPTMTALSFTMQTVDDSVATMAMVMAMTMKGPEGEMQFSLTGTAKVDRKTGRQLEMSGTGPFSANVKVKLDGTMTMKTTYAY